MIRQLYFVGKVKKSLLHVQTIYKINYLNFYQNLLKNAYKFTIIITFVAVNTNS